MINPFDRNFFKFFIGFICILSVSFGILYVVGIFTEPTDLQTAAAR